MATDREFSVVLKATDLSTQPINTIVDALKKLTEAQKANNEAAARGAITAKEFKDGLETAKSAAGGLTGAITVLQRVQDQMAAVAKQGEALANARAKLNTAQAAIPPDAVPTEKHAASITKLENSVASLQKRYDLQNATLDKYIATLEKMGVVADLSDKQGQRLLREREKATQAAAIAQERLNEKIAASPAEGERTKQQEYAIRRLMGAFDSAQSKVQQAQIALQNYESVRLNDAIVQQQVRLRSELEATEPVIARANVETLSLTENRKKAAVAAEQQAAAEKLLADQAKAAAEAEDKYNAEFAARQRAQRQAETGRFAKGGEVDVSSATAAAASELSLRSIRQSAFQDALRDQEAQAAAAKTAQERDKAADAAFVARKRAETKEASAQQIEIDKSSAAAAAANELSLRNVRRSAFEEAIADQEHRVAAEKAANAAEDADNKAFLERQRALNKERAEADQKLLVEQERINTERANLRRFDFQEAVEAQAKDEALAVQRAAAAKEQQQRLEQLLASQDKIARAQAAIPSTLPSGAVPQNPQAFSQSIQAILAPAATARETLAGVEAEINGIATSMVNAKLRSEEYDKILRQLGATFNSLARQARLVETYREQEQAIGGLLAELTKEQNVLGAMNTLYARTQVYDETQVRNILDQTNKVKGLTAAYNTQNEVFSHTKAAAQAAGIDLNNLADSERRITEAATKAAAALGEAQAKGSKGDIGFLGLRPYELQNLSYQINDVFTQLASGTSITQTFSQQVGQIFQLFQKQIVAAYTALKDIPFAISAVGVALSGLTVIVLSFARAIDVAAERRHLFSALTQDVDGSRYSVEKLLETAKGLEHLGVSLEDAAKAMRELSGAGVDPAKIKPLTELAANFANANNLKFADGFKQVMTAFTGSRADLLKFTTEMNHLLTFDQFKQVRDAAEAGDIIGAREAAMVAIFDKMREAAERNTTAIVRAFRELKAAWNAFLESVASNSVVQNFGEHMLKFLRDSITEATKLFGILDGILHLDWAAIGKAWRGEGLPNVDPRLGTGAPSVPGQRPGETAEFVALRDRVADAVGISRDAFRLLQQSEGVWDARTNKWSDALDKAGNVIENGGKGAAQVLTSTFEDLKKRYPDLIKGDIHDVTANLMAGALYFREMAEKGNNSFAKAVEAYKSGPGVAFGGQSPTRLTSQEVAMANAVSARTLAGQFTGPVITRTGAPGALESVPPVVPPTPLTGQEKQTIATEIFRKAQQDIIDSQQKAFADEDKLYEIFTRDLARAAEKVHDEATKAATAVGAERISQAEENAKTEAAQDEVRRQYHQAWLARQEEQANKYREIQQRALSSDKTNFDARMHLLELEQAAQRAALEKQQGRGLFKNAPPGQTIAEVRALQEQAQAKERTDLAVDVAKETVNAIVAQRDKQLAEIRSKAQVAPPAEQAALFAEQNRLFLSFVPKINEAVKTADAILAKLPASEAVREAQARNALVQQQARRPEAIGTGEAAAVAAISAPLQAEVDTNKSRLENIVESVKVSGVSASAALESIFTFSKKSVADLRAISDTTNAGLRSVMAQEGTTPAERSRLQAQIEANVNAPGKAAVDAQNAVMAVLAEEKAKLDKLLAEYKQAVTDLENKIRDSRLGPVQAAAERAKIDTKFIPEIARQGQTYGQTLGQAQRGAEAAGFSPGFRADLTAEQQRAETLSNEQTNRSASARKAAADNLVKGKIELSTMNETIRTQQELLKAGATTQTEAENATRTAHEAAMKAIKDLEKPINDNIKALNEMGDNQAAKKLAADFQLLQVQVAYVDPLVQKITTGLEQSFTGRGYHAIETIAQSFAKLITGQEKFKDLLGDVGNAFATFTAGVLQDIAKIIIEYTLLKTIKDALGVGPGAGAAGGGGGLGGIVGSLFGSGAGAAAGAGASAAFGTTAATAGSISAETFLGAASTGAFILHGGGTVGGDAASRVVDISVFRDAQRFHNGGMVLRRDEVPIIAQRGEKVVSLAQQRAQAAQQVAQKAQEGTAIRNVLAVGDKEIASAMNSSHGEKVMLNIMQRNAPSIKKWVG